MQTIGATTQGPSRGTEFVPTRRPLLSISSWLAAFLIIVLAPMAHAQYRASIQGVVTDSSGALVPGATLTLTDIGTNEKQVRTSDSNGVYNFNALPPDTFRLVATKKGFQTQVLDSLQLNAEQSNAVNVQMAIGPDTQSVTVNASTEAALDTETANTGQAISENQIQHMPTLSTRCHPIDPVGAWSSGRWSAVSWGRRISSAWHANWRLLWRRRQPGTLEQYLCHRKRRFGQCQRRPV